MLINDKYVIHYIVKFMKKKNKNIIATGYKACSSYFCIQK